MADPNIRAELLRELRTPGSPLHSAVQNIGRKARNALVVESPVDTGLLQGSWVQVANPDGGASIFGVSYVTYVDGRADSHPGFVDRAMRTVR